MANTGPGSISYRDAGVDIDAATRAVDRIKGFAHETFASSGAAAPIGHFGGVYRLPAAGDRFLVASADGIGTKLKLAFVLGGSAHGRVGSDLVNHCVNDIVACGSTPLFFLDYVAMGKIDGDVVESLVGGMASACSANGLALIGGETAEMPGLYADGEYDAAGFIVGEVAPDAFVDGSAVREGDDLIGLPSVGLHTNGFSLARKILGLSGQPDNDLPILNAELKDGESVGQALMEPHLSYRAAVAPLIDSKVVHGMAHITGGGLTDNVPRMLPDGLAAAFDRTTWQAPPIFDFLIERGRVEPADAYRAFNMGIGFVLAVDPAETNRCLGEIPGAIHIGGIVARQDNEAPATTGLY